MTNNTNKNNTNTAKQANQKDNVFFAVCFLVFLVCLALDLVTKSLAEMFIQRGEVIPFIPWFMNLTLSYNTGMAFSMFADNPLVMDIITWTSLPVIIGMLVVAFLLPKRFNPHRLIVSIIAAGALGNFFDRIVLEGVRDFMDISSIGFGVCNFADYCITIGGVCLFFCLLFVGEDAIFPIIGVQKNQADGSKE